MIIRNSRPTPIQRRKRYAAVGAALLLALVAACTGPSENGGGEADRGTRSADPEVIASITGGQDALESRVGEGAAEFDYYSNESVSVFFTCPGGSGSITVDMIDQEEMAPAVCDCTMEVACRMRFVQDHPQTLRVSIGEESDSWVFVTAKYQEE